MPRGPLNQRGPRMSFTTSFRLHLLMGSALLATVAAPAYAQAAADTAPQAVPGGEEVRIEEIVVTATKRETNLQKTPISMAVLGQTALKERHVQSLYDLADG